MHFITYRFSTWKIKYGLILYMHTTINLPIRSISIIIISIQPEGRFWQEPEPSQETGMALAHCILGSFLGFLGCHCFPPPFFRRSHFHL